MHADKRLGQHFLHDPRVIARIVDTIAPAAEDRIVEIGGGRGALSFPLARLVERLDVVELDPRCADALEAEAALADRLRVYRSDALRFDFGALAGTGGLRIVGNLPYNISTPLLFHLLSFRGAIRDMHLMLQKEVVVRMTAEPGGRDYGRLTVMLAAVCDVEACFDIGPGAFSPPPKVRSSFVRVVPRLTPRFRIRDEARFAATVAHLFSMRRKTIRRALKGRATSGDIEAVGIDPGARAETLAPEQFERLAGIGQ